MLGANFRCNTTTGGLTKDQLYSTKSYKPTGGQDLSGIVLAGNDLSGWNFTGENLANANFDSATLSGATLTNANVAGANFRATVSGGFTKDQLYSTASYKSPLKDLTGIDLSHNNLAGWDISGQNLYYPASCSTLTNTDLTIRNVAGEPISGIRLPAGLRPSNFTARRAIKKKNLTGIDVSGNDLSNWDFSNETSRTRTFPPPNSRMPC